MPLFHAMPLWPDVSWEKTGHLERLGEAAEEGTDHSATIVQGRNPPVWLRLCQRIQEHRRAPKAAPCHVLNAPALRGQLGLPETGLGRRVTKVQGLRGRKCSG